jgi:predicted TIM-barrel fold metal-dependent hydrolase
METDRRTVITACLAAGLVAAIDTTQGQSSKGNSTMKIVDSQVHTWRGMLPPVARHRQVQTFSADDLLQEMSAAGVDAAVLCAPAFFPQGNDENRDVVRSHPKQFANWGFFDLADPASRNLIKTWKQGASMLGARFTLLGDKAPLWTDGTIDWLWPAAAEAGVPLGFYANGHLDVIARQAERHPNLKIVIDHLAADISKRDAESFPEMPQLLALAKFPNVAVKLSALPVQSTQPYPFRNLHEPIRRAIDTFGPSRAFWGTDLTRLTCSYRQAVTMFTEEMPWLTGRDLELVMGRGLCEWLDWKAPLAS